MLDSVKLETLLDNVKLETVVVDIEGDLTN
jgi:hypothetical protein